MSFSQLSVDNNLLEGQTDCSRSLQMKKSRRRTSAQTIILCLLQPHNIHTCLHTHRPYYRGTVRSPMHVIKIHFPSPHVRKIGQWRQINTYLPKRKEIKHFMCECVCVCERDSEEEQWGRRWNNRNQEREVKRRQIMRWNDEWEREQRQSYSAEGLLTNGRNPHFKFRLCLDVIYPDHFYTWKCFQCRRWNTSS